MRKIVFFAIIIFFAGFRMAMADSGVKITGCCQSSLPVASAAGMNAMQVSVAQAVRAAEEAIVKAIKEATTASEGANANTQGAADEAAISRMKAALMAQSKIDGANRMIFKLNPDAQCCAPDASYYLQRGSENVRDAMAMFTARERNFGAGIAVDEKTKDLAFAKAAKNVEENGAILTGDVFTEKQSNAWADLVTIMFSDIKNPRPEKLDLSTVEGARYMIQEARAKELRVLLTEPFHEYGLMRQQQIPYKEILKWAPNVDQAVTYEANVNERGIIDLSKPLTKTALGPNDKISMEALLRIVGDRFTSQTYLSEVEGGDAASAAKAKLRLAGYEFYVLNEIRKGIMVNNMILSIQTEPLLAKWNADTRNVLQQ